MDIGDHCRRDVVTAEPALSARAAARLMLERNVGSLVVIDAERRPIGLVTDRDLALRIVAEERDADRTAVEGLMTRVVVTAEERESVSRVLRRMCDHRIRRLPVTRPGTGELAGIISLDDLLRAIGREMGEVAALFEAEARPGDLPTV